jgi:NADH dehydrogenase [ubiquinone] 1 alpha subcomplex assembly factor 5
VAADHFDETLRALRRQRALRSGQELFLHERAFADIVERLELVQRRFRSALFIGCADPGWRKLLLAHVDSVDVVEPDGLLHVQPGSYDLCIALGWLDTANDLQRALLTVRFALQDDSLFLGAFPGGDTLPALRAAMRAADEHMGAASPYVHPRVEPAAFASLLADAGFSMPVVDVDRVAVTYADFWRLVRDLRAMGATNILTARSRKPLTRAAIAAAAERFAIEANHGRVTERFELLHFAAWTPHAPNG